MNGYTYKQLELWYKTDRNVSFKHLEISDSTVSSEAPVTSPDQYSNFHIKCLRLVLSDGIKINQKNISMDSAISLLSKLSVWYFWTVIA